MTYWNSRACATCDYQNPVTARFCARCGAALGVTAERPQSARRWIYLAGCLVAIVLVGVGVLAAVVWGRPLFERVAVAPPTWEPAVTPTVAGGLARLPTPVNELANAHGAWTQFTNANSVNDIVFYQGHLWAATSGGVAVWDPESGRYRKYTTLDGLVSNDIRRVVLGHDGTLWFSTFGSGVSRYEPASGRWQTFAATDGLANDHVLAMTVGPDGALWFGTLDTAHDGSGVSRYEPASGRWQTFTTADGLANDIVPAMTVGPDGAIWGLAPRAAA